MIPNSVANSPAVAIRPKRFAERSAWPLASGGRLLVTNWSIAQPALLVSRTRPRISNGAADIDGDDAVPSRLEEDEPLNSVISNSAASVAALSKPFRLAPAIISGSSISVSPA